MSHLHWHGGILIDLYTEEGVIGRSYLEPYIRKIDALPHPCAPRSR